MELAEIVSSEKVNNKEVKKEVEKMKYYDEVLGTQEKGDLNND